MNGSSAAVDARGHSRWRRTEALLLGGALVVLGVLAIGAAPAAGMMTIQAVGGLLLTAAALQVIHGITHRGAPNWLVYLLSGIFTGAVGVLVITRAGLGLAALTLVVGGYFLGNGVFHMLVAVTQRYRGWGFDAFSGATSFLLGAIVVARWPSSSLWLIGTLVGIELLMGGLTLLGTVVAARRLSRAQAAAR